MAEKSSERLPLASPFLSLGYVPSRGLLSLAGLVRGRGLHLHFPSQMFLLCRGVYLAAKNLWCSTLARLSPSPPPFEGTAVQNSCVLHSPWPASQAGWGPANSLLHNSLSSLPGWIQWEQTVLSIWSLCRVFAQPPFSSFLKVSTWYPHCSTESLCGSLHIPFPKKQNVFHGHSWLHPANASDRPRCSNLIVLGDRVLVWNSPGWCYHYGHAARCVCVACTSQTMYILPSLSRLGLEIPVWD